MVALITTLFSHWFRRAFTQSAVAMTVIGGGAGEVTNVIDLSDVPPAPVVIVDLSHSLPTNGEYPWRDRLPETLTIHHTASTGQGWGTIADFHVRVNNWKAIGYAFGTSWDGKMFKLHDPNRKQNQVRGRNSTTIGLVMLGNFHTGVLSKAQEDATRRFAAYLCDHYGYRYIRPHRDFVSTACPGQHAMQQLQDLWIRP
jgi:hypothetical protein